MNRDITIAGVIEHGRFSNQARLDATIRMLDTERVAITVRRVKARRSLSQNALYWTWCIPHIVEMFREAGTDIGPDECHEFVKMHVIKLHKPVLAPDGSVALIGGTTTTMTKAEFSAAIETIGAWCAEMGSPLPEKPSHA